MSNQSIAYYRMVRNFREGFIFAFFGSQEPFAKIKTAKILLFTCKANELCFSPRRTWNYLYSHQQKGVSECAFEAIAEAIQEIEVAQTAARPRAEAIVITNVLSTKLLSFSLHWNKELKLPSLFVKDSRHSLSF